MKPKTYAEQHRTLGALLRRPYDALSERLYAKLGSRGFPEIRPAHASLLRHLRPNGSRVADLADAAHMAKQSMAYLADDLRAAGFLTIEPDRDDRRAKVVTLTAKGRRAAETFLSLSAEIEGEFAALLGRTEMLRLRELLEELGHRLDQADAIDSESGRAARPSKRDVPDR